ncbi:MAG: hypothetical protein QXI28_04840 [Candidatus Hadarchaeales archaeon]
MSGQVFSIPLPPEGFIIRDFALTALAEIASRAGGNLEIDVQKATIQNVPSAAVIKSYSELLQQVRQTIRLFPTDKRHAKKKIFQELEKLNIQYIQSPTNLVPDLEAYGKWIAAQTPNTLNSLQQLQLWPESDVVLKWGSTPDIPALQYFKLNFYAGQRAFLPPRRLDAGMKLDIHATMLLLLGSSLSLIGTRRVDRVDRVDVHLSYQDPGAKQIWNSLRQLVQRIRLQTEPLLLFRLATAFSLTTPGLQPLALFEVSLKGNRPSLLSYRHIEVDHPVYALLHSLKENRKRLMNLLTFALRNWNEGGREIHLVNQVAYDLSKAIFLTLTGAPLDSEGEFYRIIRYTCETTSEEFSKALEVLKKEIGFTRNEFRDLLEDIIEKLARKS